MLGSKRDQQEGARQKAFDRFAKAAERESDFRKEKDRIFNADAAKTAKLRALRMAKEAVDQELAAKAAAEKASAPVRRKRVAVAT
jgi:hypothetical protein